MRDLLVCLMPGCHETSTITTPAGEPAAERGHTASPEPAGAPLAGFVSASCQDFRKVEAREVPFMSKASRQRQLKQERERKQRRAAQPSASSPSGPSRPPHETQRHDVPPRTGRGTRRDIRHESPPQAEQPSQRELAAAGVAEALQSLAQGSQDQFLEWIEALAGQQQRPGWDATVSRELVSYLRASVSRAWRHGWQPAELVRHTGREKSDSHARMATDMIAEEMRGYAAATVDDRWLAQLSALRAKVWWGSDDAYLARWRGREGNHSQATLITAVELLFLLGRLPVLPQLCPLPGTVRPGAVAGPGPAGEERTADERILGKIRALLAKAESTEFTEEAEALSARAQELMAKYSIDHALLAAEAGRKDEPASRRLPVDNPYEGPKVQLLQEVAKANRCRTVWYKNLGMSVVIGFPADVGAVELLFTSLLVQANTAMLRAGAKRDQYGRSRTRSFRQSFLTSYAIRIGERLAGATGDAERQVAAEAPGRNLLPVLAARHQAVDDAVDEMFGGRVSYYRTGRVSDSEGWYSGRAAADTAALHGHREVTPGSA
jgi:hypothetical protein